MSLRTDNENPFCTRVLYRMLAYMYQNDSLYELKLVLKHFIYNISYIIIVGYRVYSVHIIVKSNKR